MKLEEIKNTTKDAIDHLIRSLESGHSEVLAEYLSAMAHFRTYSFGNVMLIASQRPDATHVCGIRGWNALGRFVKRGEKGILILAPMVRHRRLRQHEIAAEQSVHDESTQRLIGFRAVYVFDVAQTEGQDLPSLSEVNMLLAT
jgi:N-terminal domain of anti-restriction factor ArdC